MSPCAHSDMEIEGGKASFEKVELPTPDSSYDQSFDTCSIDPEIAKTKLDDGPQAKKSIFLTILLSIKTFLQTDPEHAESNKSFLILTSLPLFFNGIGEVFAGIILSNLATGSFLTDQSMAMVLIPPLSGLKGNLESTLGSRLSTWSNLGLLKTREQKWQIYIASASLDQAQALVIGFLATCVAMMFYYFEDGSNITWNRISVLYLAALLTSSVTSYVFSGMMFGVTILATHWKVNPDNIVTPFAAMMGDCVTIPMFVLWGTILNNHREGNTGLYLALIGGLLLSSVFWMCVTYRNPLTRPVLKFGWFTIIIAMIISTSGGHFLRQAYNTYAYVSNFQPVLAGVGGNRASIQASRISSYLHKHGKYGILPANSLITYLLPWRTYSCQEDESVKAVILTTMHIIGNAVFAMLIYAMDIGFEHWNWIFYGFYLLAAFVHVSILLYICQFLTRAYWLLKINPDNNTIPILTSLGDLFGSLLLLSVFVLLNTWYSDY